MNHVKKLQDELGVALCRYRIDRCPGDGAIEVSGESPVVVAFCKLMCQVSVEHLTGADVPDGFWRQIFLDCLPTLGLDRSGEEEEWLRTLERTLEPVGQSELRFAVLREQIAYPGCRGGAMKKMMGMALTKDQLLSRDFLLVGILAQEEGMEVSERDRIELAEAVSQEGVVFSLRKYEKEILGLARSIKTRSSQ